MGFSRFSLTMADKEFKVHHRVICMIFPMIERAKNVSAESATCLRQRHVTLSIGPPLVSDTGVTLTTTALCSEDLFVFEE